MISKNPLLVPYPKRLIPGRRYIKQKEITVKINLGTVMLDVQKNPLKGEKVGGVDTNLILKDVVMSSLLGMVHNEQLSGEEKYKRYKLFKRIDESESLILDFTEEEVVKFKDLIGRFYTPLVVGRAIDALEIPVVD